jgi:hypothetical protein
VDEEVLGVGGFHKVFKATSNTHEFADSTWVVKKYLSEDSELRQKAESLTISRTKSLTNS